MIKVPVVFAGGEKWAMIKRNRGLRDQRGSLILPIITIGRSSAAQTMADDITGRGINQRTGEITVRRKLDKSDRGYQNLINKIYLRNQGGLAVAPSDSTGGPGQLTTLRAIGELADDGVIGLGGGFLAGNRLDNVYETLVIPSPQFYTANYEVIVWTQYTHHMNQIIETMLSSFLPQTQGWRIDTPKGYWFVASIADDIYAAETNFDDMSAGERLIKYKFNVKVPAYVLASTSPGVPLAVRRYVSAPDVTFNAGLPISEVVAADGIDDPTLGSDDPTLPLSITGNSRADQRADGRTRLFIGGEGIDPNDPALLSIPRGRPPAQYKRITVRAPNGKLVTRLVRAYAGSTSSGETVFSPGTDLGDLQVVIIDE